MDIYVGNLAYATTDDSLRAAFAAFGEVTSARVVTDRATGRSKGFGFVEMPNEEEANAAIAALNETELDGRTIRANESQNRGAPGERRSFGGPRRGGFGGRREGGFSGRREGGFGGRREGGYAGRREGGYGGDRRRDGGYGRRDRGDAGFTARESQW